MKRCSKCGKIKPLSEFHKKSTNKDGLCYHCKTCHNEYQRNRYDRKRIKPKRIKPEIIDYLGGYTISILNYAKKGEYKFNITSTTGKSFNSNDKKTFLSKIQELVNG